MPRAKYSQKQADRMLTPGRVFYLNDTGAAVVVLGRDNGGVRYSFLDAPGDNRSTVVELYPRVAGFGDVRRDYTKKVEKGEKVTGVPNFSELAKARDGFDKAFG